MSACSSALFPFDAPARPVAPVAQQAAQTDDFSGFVAGLWPEAQKRGISRQTFDLAFAGVTPDPKVIELTRKQAEFVKPIWDYMASAVSDKRLERGRAAVAQWRHTLDQVARTYGVDRKVLAGVWGMESNFGSNYGNHSVVRSLATLAYDRYRGDYFKGELLTALKIIDEGNIAPAAMIGSWAGAMGQTQFMPSSYMRFAVDYDGDGRRDIWGSVPDALASTANYLKKNGWQEGLPWGFEVKAPDRAGRVGGHRSFAAWARLGVRRVDGHPMPANGEASLLYPAGAHGPAFLVTHNFKVIKRYNNSNAYALGVGHLGDRVYGAGPIQTSWPVADLPLSRGEGAEMQRRLTALGYDVGEPDGRLGTRTTDALRAYQEKLGLVPDGYPSRAMLTRLRMASR